MAASVPAFAQAGGAGGKAKPEVRLNRDQQKVVLSDIDATLKFASKDTKLELKRTVKGVFVSREEVGADLRKRFDEDESAKRMQRSELVLKKLGLLDRDFQLRPFLLKLLTEQIAGFYDDKTHVMNLLDWVPEDEQLPVMAHELTHALQDQRVGLEKWNDQEVKGIAKNVTEDNRHLRSDETDTGRQAAVEGQAMVAFADYALQPAGKTVKDVPEMVDRIVAGAADMSTSPEMSRAPLLLQQSLIFPYAEGFEFVAAVLGKQGVTRAFAGVLDSPPSSTFEVLHPDQYLAHVPVPVLVLPDLHPMLESAGYAPYDVGVMGEVDVRIMAELLGGRPLADGLAPAWNGGVYLAAQRKSAVGPAKDSTASLGLIYASRWRNSGSARNFFTLYEGGLARKYSGLKRRKADETSEDERVYSTAEGDVLLTVNDTSVFVSEGFDVAMGRKMREAVEAAQGSGPVQSAGVAGPELVGGLSGWLGGFGMMRFALRGLR